MPLINCEVSLTLTWSENCVLTNITTEDEAAPQGDNAAGERIDAPTYATRWCNKYYVPKAGMKEFNVLIDGKSFFDVPVKNKEQVYKKTMNISKNNEYTTGNLLVYKYFWKHYKLIAIDLSKRIKLEYPDLRQQIYFIGKLEDDKATVFLIINKSEGTTFKFLQDFVSIV